MDKCPHFDHLLVIPRVRVQNANAISSPLTHGFPAMTAFLGLMWALERRTKAAGLDLRFNAVGVVCHAHQEQITHAGFVSAFRLTRNPIEKDGSVAAIVEEGRIHLDVTLVFAVQSDVLRVRNDPAADIAAVVRDLVMQMRIAGGSVIPSVAPPIRQVPYFVHLTGDDEGRDRVFNGAKLRLLPGFTLVSRDDLLERRHEELKVQQPQVSRLDAWLSLSRINWRSEEQTVSEREAPKTKWTHDRKKIGWVVPIPVGYSALTDLQAPGSVVNARDSTTAFRFVESLYSVGQWLSPHRLETPQQLLWYSDSHPESSLYRCRNDYQPPRIYDFD